jgi:integrase
MAKTNKLTDTAIKAAIANRKPAKLFDGGGLYLLVSAPSQPAAAPEKPEKGAASESPSAYWRHKFYFVGKERLISHGVYPRVTLKMARKRRDEARGLLECGIDPSAQRRAVKAALRTSAENSFEAVAREWYGKRAKAWAANHASKVLGRLTADVFPWLGSTPIASITGRQLLDTLQRVETRGAVDSARRIRQNMELIFAYAKETGRFTGENPTPKADALESPIKGKFASITDPKGVGRLIKALRGYDGTLVTRTALGLAPLLFVRPGELRGAEWQEFDLDAAEWRIPAERMKTRVAHFVPLPRQAVALLRELKPLSGHGRFVFPSERGGQRCMSSNTLNAALRGLGFSKEQMTTHGFRHLASTLLNESGKWNADAIERQMAHTPRNAVRAVYNAAQHLPERRKMMQWWADYLDTLASVDEKVVGIRAARR